jgi:uncharacterized CHY-type Zn-finger protein
MKVRVVPTPLKRPPRRPPTDHGPVPRSVSRVVTVAAPGTAGIRTYKSGLARPESVRREVHGRVVAGVGVDGATRCAHYHGARDVVALRLPCCVRPNGAGPDTGPFSPCHACHAAVADHDRERWPGAVDAPAVLCGACGTVLSVANYLGTTACPDCGTGFNPGCRDHYDRYVALE